MQQRYGGRSQKFVDMLILAAGASHLVNFYPTRTFLQRIGNSCQNPLRLKLQGPILKVSSDFH